MKNKSLNTQAAHVHKIHIQWWRDIHTGLPINKNSGELLMLVITELAEAVEGIRKNLMDDKLPHRKMEEVEMADAKIRLLDLAGGFGLDLWENTENQKPHLEFTGNKAEEILRICHMVSSTSFAEGLSVSLGVSLIIRAIETYCRHYQLDLEGAILEKLEYNQKRQDHKVEHRRSEHGKKF